MKNSSRFLAAVLASIVLAAISLFHAPSALAWPAQCKPNSGGTQDCISRTPTPFYYLNSGCGQNLNWPSEAQALARFFADHGNGSCPAPTRSGWIPRSAPSCINGPCVLGSDYIGTGGCPGEPHQAPGYTGDLEVMNWLVYDYSWSSSVTCAPPSHLTATIRRNRQTICQAGYTASNGVCVLSQLDPSKNVGGQCPTCGNPISPGTGNKFQRETDYTGTGEFPLVFERYYNSQLRIADSDNNFFSDTTYNGLFGLNEWRALAVKQHRTGLGLSGQDRRDSMRWSTQGIDMIGANWRHTYQRSIYYVESPTVNASSALVFRQDGRVLSFVEYSGAFYPQADISDRLTGSPSTGWTYTSAANDEVETYDADGRLLSIRSRGGLTHTLAYDADGRVTSVTDDFGRSLTFTYDAPAGDVNAVGRVASMTNPAGGGYQYGYTGANLTSVTFPDSTTRQYVYAGSTARALTGIVDENGVTYATFAYNQYGEATLSTHAGGAGQVSIVYTKQGVTNVGPATTLDALGAARRYEFTNLLGVAKVTSIRQPAASGSGTVTRTFSYDANGNIRGEVDYRGVLTCHTYDLGRNLETSRIEGLTGSSCPGTSVAGVTRTTTTSWHSTFRIPTQITVYAGGSASGTPLRQTTFTHDSSGNILTRTMTDYSVTPNVSRTTTNTYDSFGRILTSDGPRSDVNDITTYTYYSCTSGYQCGRLHTVTDAAGHVTTYNSYSAHGAPLTITDQNSIVTTLAYDLRQRLSSRTTDGEAVTLTYWPTGLLKRVTQPDASYLEYHYDSAHRLDRITDGEGNRVSYTLDGMGNHLTESTYDPSDALSRTKSQVFNILNQLRKQIGAAGTPDVTALFSYDNEGNQIAVAAPLNRNTASQFDELGRLKQTTDAESGDTSYGYDALGNLTSVEDPNGHTTSNAYNGFGDLVTQVSPDTGTTVSAYDAAGNLATKTDARNVTGTYSYDSLNRLTSISYPDQTVMFGYDSGANGVGRLTSASDANHSMSWAYDLRGRIASKTQAVGSVSRTVGYDYVDGNLSSIVTPSGQTISYGYTEGRITSIAVNGTTVLNGVLYEPFGSVRQWAWGNGTASVRTHDTDGRVTQVDSGGEFYGYAYDDASRIVNVGNASDANLTWGYDYDGQDRLTLATSPLWIEGWTYDANGNRLTRSGNVLGESFVDTNAIASTSSRLASVSGTNPNIYSYDNAGNTTAETASRRPVSVGAANVVSYTYNAMSQRVRKSGTGIDTYFVYDEAGHLLGEYGAGGALIQETVWMNDTPVATLRPHGSSVDVYYVHADHLDTPRKITRPDDNVLVWRWDSDAFGGTLPDENPEDAGTFRYNLRFPGQYYDGESGLHYNYRRDYDPAVGRYTQSDPIGLQGGANTYVYVKSSPLLNIDPLGLLTVGTSRALPDENTIICDGNGGIAIQLAPLDPLNKKCIGDCILVHEQVHLQSTLRQAPSICAGRPQGLLVQASNRDEKNEEEIPATKAELECLERKLEQLSPNQCHMCEEPIRQRIRQQRDYLQRARRYEL